QGRRRLAGRPLLFVSACAHARPIEQVCLWWEPVRRYFPALAASLRSRNLAAQPAFSTCCPLPRASASGATSSVITEPDPVKAPSPTTTGATSDELEPTKAPAPTVVWNLSKPS